MAHGGDLKPEKHVENDVEISPDLGPDLALNERLQATHLEHLSKAERVAAIDAIAEDPNVTLESFAHLDIKKVASITLSPSNIHQSSH